MTKEEQYTVKFNRQKEDGYWIYGKVESVFVKYSLNNEKNNHDKAAKYIKNKYKNNKVEIVNVSYC